MRRLLTAAILALSATNASAVTLTFEDLKDEAPTPIYDGYGGLNWDNFYAKASDGNVFARDIFVNKDAAFSSNTPFFFQSIDVHSSASSPVTFTGFTSLSDSAAAYTFTTGSTGQWESVQFSDWLKPVQKVVVFSKGVTRIDNLTYNGKAYGAPEPTTLGMTLAGLGLIGWAARRRAKSEA